MLRTLVRQMQTFTGRKTLVLVSGGMIASDSPGGRPGSRRARASRSGRRPPIANTAIYTLFIDSSLHDRLRGRDEKRRPDGRQPRRATPRCSRAGSSSSRARPAARSSPSRSATPTAALARIQNELSSYYLLGVEPADEDRDGRTHESHGQDDPAERHDSWPAVGDGARSAERAAATQPATPTPAAVRAAAAGRGAAAPRMVPPDVQALADVFDRGNERRVAEGARCSRATCRARSAGSGSRTARGRTIAAHARSSRWNSLSPASAASIVTRATRAAGCSPSTTSASASRLARTTSNAGGS